MPEVTQAEQDIETLRSIWKTLYSQTLPSLARAKDGSQPKWPVTLDHCFARIILDNTIGAQHATGDANTDAKETSPKDSDASDDGGINGDVDSIELLPWDTVIARPAIRNMDAGQLHAAIDLGERIQRGEIDLVDLDRRSLVGRGKSDAKYGGKTEQGAGKRKRGGKDQRGPSSKSTDGGKKKQKKQAMLSFQPRGDVDRARTNDEYEEDGQMKDSSRKGKTHDASRVASLEDALDTRSQLTPTIAVETLRRIQSDQSLTPFRRDLYTSLLSVPRGQYTTYAALAEHLGSVARAVGNGMRNNPFAPDVPCHRVLASDGTIGGFGGDWGRDGKLTEKQHKKVELLKNEGVRFDSAGKVKGMPWSGFWDLKDFVNEYGDLTPSIRSGQAGLVG